MVDPIESNMAQAGGCLPIGDCPDEVIACLITTIDRLAPRAAGPDSKKVRLHPLGKMAQIEDETAMSPSRGISSSDPIPSCHSVTSSLVGIVRHGVQPSRFRCGVPLTIGARKPTPRSCARQSEGRFGESGSGCTTNQALSAGPRSAYFARAPVPIL